MELERYFIFQKSSRSQLSLCTNTKAKQTKKKKKKLRSPHKSLFVILAGICCVFEEERRDKNRNLLIFFLSRFGFFFSLSFFFIQKTRKSSFINAAFMQHTQIRHLYFYIYHHSFWCFSFLTSLLSRCCYCFEESTRKERVIYLSSSNILPIIDFDLFLSR